MQTPMVEEDEIDLRPYIATILRRWRLIAAIAAIAIAVAAAVSLASPTQYEATAAVAIAPPGAQPTPQAKAYTDLATSDAVVAPLAEELAANGGPALPAAELRSKLGAAPGSEPRLVGLTVRDTDADRAARIASAWVPVFARVAANSLNNPAETLADLERQLAAAREQLAAAETELAAQERQGGAADLEARVAAAQRNLQDLYAARAALPPAREQLAAIRTRAASRDPASTADAADQLEAAGLAARLVGYGSPPSLPAPGAAAPTNAALVAYLDSLARLLDRRAAGLDGEIAATRAALLDAQAALQNAQDARAPVQTRRDALRRTVLDLERRAVQIDVASRSGVNRVRPVGDAAPRAVPLPRSTSRNVALGAIVGLMAGTAAAFGWEWLAARRAPAPQG